MRVSHCQTARLDPRASPSGIRWVVITTLEGVFSHPASVCSDSFAKIDFMEGILE
jgi:hypothetical protein